MLKEVEEDPPELVAAQARLDMLQGKARAADGCLQVDDAATQGDFRCM